MYGFNNNFMYQPNQFQAYPDNLSSLRQQQIQPQIPTSPIIWVQGENSAKSYLLTNNSTVVLRDSEKPNTLYIKSTDQNGIPNIEVFTSTTPSVAQPTASEQPKVAYVTRSEFESLVERLNTLTDDCKKFIRKEETPNE